MTEARKSRIFGEQVNIDGSSIKAFFERRGQHVDAAHPYTSILYQDHDPSLAERRDAHEKEKILPQLLLSKTSHVFDIGCGMGRWADVVLPKAGSYVGVDVSDSLVDQARQRIKGNAEFHVMPASDIAGLHDIYAQRFTRVIISGLLLYLNDSDLQRLMAGIPQLCDANCRIYFREPLAIAERMTLDRHWSEELQAEYSSIYRSKNEMLLAMAPLLECGFKLSDISRLYEQNDLNNRQETAQFYFFADRGDLP